MASNSHIENQRINYLLKITLKCLGHLHSEIMHGLQANLNLKNLQSRENLIIRSVVKLPFGFFLERSVVQDDGLLHLFN